MLRIGSLFSGYGGLDMAAQSVLGGTVAWHCDVKPAAVALLDQLHPGVPNLGDITRLFPAVGPLPLGALAVESVDVLTFGWPCQPHSSAGKRLGEVDPRALWPNVARVVSELRPAVLLGENVARISTNGELRRAVGALAALGYVGSWRCVTASSIGASHKRDRCFLVAVRADAAADTLGVELWHEPGRGRGQGGAGAGVAGDHGAARSAGLTLLPTPTKSMTTGAGTSGRDGGLNLQTAVTLLPTPKASDGPKDGPGMRGSSGDLTMPSAAVLMHGSRWGVYAEAIERWERTLGRPAPAPTMPSMRAGGGPQLAPAFVEWMMGLPEGLVSAAEHLALRPAGMRSARLSLLGDGVVPQQAGAAFRTMLGELLARRAAA